MAVLIDPPLWPAHGRRWSHLASDVSLAELHAFAVRAGIPERGFEGDHYDVPEERYADTVAAGAMPVSSRELLRRLQDSGLRRPKRRGEKVLLSAAGPREGHRVDAVLSALPPLGPVTAVHAVVVAGRDLLVLPDDVGFRLPAQVLGDEPDALGAARSLVVALVGGVAVPGTDGGSRVGYLRRVAGARGPADPAGTAEDGGPDEGPDGGTVVGEDGGRRGVVGAVVGNEIVLRFVLSGAGRPRAAGGAVWAPAQQVVALMEGPLAALAAGAAYRPPERARSQPVRPAP